MPREHWVPKGVDCEIPHELKRGTSATKNASLQRELDYEILHQLKTETKHGVKTSP